MVGSLGSSGPPTMSPATAAIFIFNLIVGTGALALPAAFQSAGIVMGVLLLLFLALTSYITATWVIEAMAAVNGIINVEEACSVHNINKISDDGSTDEDEEEDEVEIRQNTFFDDHEDDRQFLVKNDLVGQKVDIPSYGATPLDPHTNTRPVCNLDRQLELAAMADILYNKTGKVLFSICMILYLYGDLAIYCTAIAKSLRDVTCTDNAGNCTGVNVSLPATQCWKSLDLDKQNVYRVYVCLFICLLGPFTFFNVTKTKYLQMLTTLMRWAAFTAMIGLAIARIANSHVPHGSPKVFSLSSIPEVFGVSVYAFMCHHSIPGLISPVKDKSKLGITLGSDYLLIAAFYLILSLTGIFAFPSIPDLYTLAFKPSSCSGTIGVLEVVDYFLALFPVFTLSTNFPIIAITLKNNLESIVLALPGTAGLQRYRRVVFPLLAILPPAGIALLTENLGILVTITGAYAGAGIQYVIPATLVLLARRRLNALQAATNNTIQNKYSSWFGHWGYIVGVLGWSALAVGLVTANFIIKAL